MELTIFESKLRLLEFMCHGELHVGLVVRALIGHAMSQLSFSLILDHLLILIFVHIIFMS